MANIDNDDNYDRLIPQAKLKEVLDKELAILGEPIQEIVFEQLSRYGITFDNESKSSYSIRQLQNTLVELFGSDAALLIMERLHKVLPSEHDKEKKGNGTPSFLIGISGFLL